MSIQQTNKKPWQVVDLLLTNGRSERDEVGQQPNERRTNYEVLRSTWFAWMDLNHILISGEKKMIDIMGVSGATSNITHSPIGQFVRTSPVEFSFAPTNQEKKLLESLDRMFLLYTMHVKVLKARAQNFVAWIELAWVSGLPKGLGERRFAWVGGGGRGKKKGRFLSFSSLPVFASILPLFTRNAWYSG